MRQRHITIHIRCCWEGGHLRHRGEIRRVRQLVVRLVMVEQDVRASKWLQGPTTFRPSWQLAAPTTSPSGPCARRDLLQGRYGTVLASRLGRWPADLGTGSPDKFQPVRRSVLSRSLTGVMLHGYTTFTANVLRTGSPEHGQISSDPEQREGVSPPRHVGPGPAFSRGL